MVGLSEDDQLALAMRLSLDENAAAAAQCNPAAGDAAALERTVSSRDVTAIDSSHEEFATAHASEAEDELPSVNFDSKSISVKIPKKQKVSIAILFF